jgi:hypothetical protein
MSYELCESDLGTSRRQFYNRPALWERVVGALRLAGGAGAPRTPQEVAGSIQKPKRNIQVSAGEPGAAY